jgi:hypothetical protein
VVNGGATRVYFYTVLTNPARVRAPVVGKIKELKSGPWKYRLDYHVPETLQVVAGVPITVTELDITAGKGDYPRHHVLPEEPPLALQGVGLPRRRTQAAHHRLDAVQALERPGRQASRLAPVFS